MLGLASSIFADDKTVVVIHECTLLTPYLLPGDFLLLTTFTSLSTTADEALSDHPSLAQQRA